MSLPEILYIVPENWAVSFSQPGYTTHCYHVIPYQSSCRLSRVYHWYFILPHAMSFSRYETILLDLPSLNWLAGPTIYALRSTQSRESTGLGRRGPKSLDSYSMSPEFVLLPKACRLIVETFLSAETILAQIGRKLGIYLLEPPTKSGRRAGKQATVIPR